jgi:F-type H+-transporting ATPase subunit a
MLSGTELESASEAAQHGGAAATGAGQAAEHAAEAAGGGGDAAGQILHHILDDNKFEIPLLFKWNLPAIHIPEGLPLIGGADISITKHVLMMWIAAGLLLLMFGLAARRAKDPVPRGLRNMLEVLIVFLRDEVARKSIPHGADKFLGYLMTTFFFILTCNLLGLVPTMATATGNISVTAGLAVIAFLIIQAGGIREFGVIKHFKNLVPPGLPMWLVPIMFVLELLSMFIKPFALCIRLFANMMAGHVVILAFISLIFILSAMFSPVVGIAASPFAVAFALFVYLLEILVAFLQAYIFTMLTAQFIGMSVHPAH